MTKFPTLQTRNKRQSIEFRVFAHQQSNTVYYYREINTQPERIESENIMQQLTFLASTKTILLFFLFFFF